MIKLSRTNAPQQTSAYIIELVGLAGAGKTTVAAALSSHNNNTVIDADISIKTKTHFALFAATIPKIVPLLLHQKPQNRWFTWDEIKTIVYLTSWPHKLRQSKKNGVIILLDHGPIFKLATLKEFGPSTVNNPIFERWWNHTIKLWANTLDLIIWLEAPQTTLIERINSRSQKHPVKNKSANEAAKYLMRYQSSYAKIMVQVANFGSLRQLHFDTNYTSVNEIIDKVQVYLSANSLSEKADLSF